MFIGTDAYHKYPKPVLKRPSVATVTSHIFSSQTLAEQLLKLYFPFYVKLMFY